jgi:hypothetical protein
MTPQPQPPFSVPENRIDTIFQLITRLAQQGKVGSFRVYPPQVVIDDPGVLQADDIVDRLRDTTWQVRFYDGHVERFNLVEMVTFRHLISDVRSAMGRAGAAAKAHGSTLANPASINRTLHIPTIMAPASVKRLLNNLPLQATSSPQ